MAPVLFPVDRLYSIFPSSVFIERGFRGTARKAPKIVRRRRPWRLDGSSTHHAIERHLEPNSRRHTRLEYVLQTIDIYRFLSGLWAMSWGRLPQARCRVGEETPDSLRQVSGLGV